MPSLYITCHGCQEIGPVPEKNHCKFAFSIRKSPVGTSIMGKKSKSHSQKQDAAQSSGLPFLGGSSAVDPGVASLFEQSVCILSCCRNFSSTSNPIARLAL